MRKNFFNGKKYYYFVNFFCLLFLLLSCKEQAPLDEDESSIIVDCPTSTDTATECSKSGVLLQVFNWNSCKVGNWYSVISDNALQIKDNFEYAWFPPVSDSTSDNGYLPRRLNSLTSAYGDKTTLKQAITDITPTKAIADIVINHRCGSTSWGDFTEPSWGVVKGSNYQAICSSDEGFSNDEFMRKVAGASRGNDDTGDGYDSGRDLDHTNNTVNVGIISWMIDVLKDVGFVGWRYDFVKGYHGKYVGYYNAQTGSNFSVGEYWPSNAFSKTNPSAWASEIEKWIAKTSEPLHQVNGKQSRAFDFVLKGIMNSVFGSKTTSSPNSNYALLANTQSLMRSQPEYAVTFVDNHDTGSTQNLWSIDTADVGIAYAMILTHPGFPCVAWQHYFSAAESDDSGSQYIGDKQVPGTTLTYKNFINMLITLRKESGIEYDSSIEVLKSTSTCYVAKITGANKSVIVMIGSGYSSTGNVYLTGKDFTIWN